MRELSESVAGSGAFVLVSSSLKRFFELRKVGNVTESDVIVNFILSSKNVVVFARFLDPSKTVRLVLRDIVSHKSFNL
tara:strand:+ start:358 stop:591 length:234 start_codon:yes stop_codon:yes gene_type:complete